jgi:hypothetical protein
MMNGNQAEIRAIVCAVRSELEETIQHEIIAVIQHIRSEFDETSARNEATETEPDPGKMQSAEHQEIPKEEAAVMPVRGLTKQQRDRNLAAGRRQKLKGRIQASCESRRRLTVAGNMTRRATLAWRRKNAVRKIVDRARNLPSSE